MQFLFSFAARAVSSNSYVPSCRCGRFLLINPLRNRHSWLSLACYTKGDWPDNSLNARVARCITRKCIDVVALVDGMCWVIEVKPIVMIRAIAGSFEFDRWW